MKLLPAETIRLTRIIKSRGIEAKTETENNYWTRLLIQLATISNIEHMYSNDPNSGLLLPHEYQRLMAIMKKPHHNALQALASMYQRKDIE